MMFPIKLKLGNLISLLIVKFLTNSCATFTYFVKSEDLLTSYSEEIIEADPMYRNISPNTTIPYGPSESFVLMDFRNPHHMGVCSNVHKEWIQLMTELKNARHRFVKLDISQAQLGQKVIWTDPHSDRPQNVSKWTQPIWRGVVAASILEQNLVDVTERVKKQLTVCVEMIDHGVTYNANLKDLSYYSEEDATYSYGIRDLFRR